MVRPFRRHTGRPPRGSPISPEMRDMSPMPQRWPGPRVLLGGLLILALLIRLVGLGWGLPNVYHPDEPTHVDIVLKILKTGDWNPHWFKYPSFRIYISVPVAIAYFLLGVSRGQFRSMQELQAAEMLTLGSGTTEIPGLYYGLRLLMTLFGVVSVAVLWQETYRRWGARAAWLAALFLCFSPLHVMVGHWYRPDTALALFSGAAVMAAVALYRRDELCAYLLCGALAGLAASVKYNAAITQLVPILLAHLLARRSLFDWRLWITPLIAGAVFVAITPFALLDLPTFLDGFAFEINHYYVRGHAGADSTMGMLGNLIWYGGKLLFYDGPLVLLALLAFPFSPRERRAEVLVLASWPLLILLLNATARVRTVLALVPMLLILYQLAAIGGGGLLGRLAHSKSAVGRGARWCGVVVALLLLIPLAQTTLVASRFARPDVRTLTTEWLEQNTAPQDRIAIEAYGPVLRRPGARYTYLLIGHTPEWYQAAGLDYFVASHYWTFLTSPDLYPEQTAAYERLFQFPLVQSIRGPLQYLYDPIREIRIHRVPLPARYELAMSEGDAPWLLEGFFAPEEIGGYSVRWTASRAVIELRLKRDVPYVARCSGFSPRPTTAGEAISTLWIDGQQVGSHTWSTQYGEWTTPFTLAPGERDVERVHLVLETNPWRPSEHLASQDDRQLGILLHKIVVEESGGR